MNFVFTMDDIFEQHILKGVYKGLRKENVPDDVIQMFLFIAAKHVLYSYTSEIIEGQTFVMRPKINLGPLLGELSMVMNARYDSHEDSVPFRMWAFDLANSNIVRHDNIQHILQVGDRLYKPCTVRIINPAYGVAYFLVE